MFERSSVVNIYQQRASDYASKRVAPQNPIPPLKRSAIVKESSVEMEVTDRASVLREMQAREDDQPTKQVLVTDPLTGKQNYERRKERESNAFITLNTHQIPKIGKTEKPMQIALELVINKLFSESEMQNWIEIKQPFRSKGDVFTLDPKPETSIFRSMKVLPAIEIGPINQMLHAHIILELSHFSLIQYNAMMLGQRAAELWRDIFPMDLTPDRSKDVDMRTILECYYEERDRKAIQPDFSIQNDLLYADLPGTIRYYATGVPMIPRLRRGFHRIQNTGQFKTLFKDQKLFSEIGTNRKMLEQSCRKYVAQNLDLLELDKDRRIYHTKTMYCQIQITKSNAEKNRMNYIHKNRAAGATTTTTGLSQSSWNIQ